MILQKIWSYITFRKQPEFREENQELNFNSSDTIDDQSPSNAGKDISYLKMMHGINRISIFMFIIGLIVVIIKIFK